ncbi:DUF1850 domain-containing protein [Salicibibacter kimchii]|uniref:DUF1850 domain-containing protein n=1 Tax=Salicibibacter kimchii TaxID=2099786 RepID=UPI00135A521E|nr:DUF1850 domain-containing protein [Salicibibacter kimchii]
MDVSWTHSVEHTPWVETLRISEDGDLIMVETQFQSYGAGAPENTSGTVSIEDGFIVISGINEVYETYNWFHSHHADFTITVGDETTIEPTDLPDQTAIEMKVERSLFYFSG